MSVVGCRYTLNDNVVMGTLDLWRVSGKMPVSMHEKRQFSTVVGNDTYVFVLDISKFGTVLETCRYNNKIMSDYCRSKVKDMYFENGAFVIDTRKGKFRMDLQNSTHYPKAFTAQ